MVFPEINLQSGVPIYQQLKQSLRRLTALKLIEADEQLPSVRQLAVELGINPNTVQKAYRDLEADGIIYTVPGRGSFVAHVGDDFEAPKQEIKELFDESVKIAFVSGMDADMLHPLLDESIALFKDRRGARAVGTEQM